MRRVSSLPPPQFNIGSEDTGVGTSTSCWPVKPRRPSRPSIAGPLTPRPPHPRGAATVSSPPALAGVRRQCSGEGYDSDALSTGSAMPSFSSTQAASVR
ncbi:hypothetical protein PF003_g27755 [Phytophthora fragariae]|nr:hypothetical protein PF003_g27755 [Phytophthora fragariae]